MSVSAHIVGRGTHVAFGAHGEVHGSNEPGDREHSWKQEGHSEAIRADWFALYGGQIHHNLQYDVDIFGSAGAVAAFVAKAALTYVTAGSAGVVIVLGSEAVSALEIEGLALPHTVGVFAAGAVLLVGGQGALLPALVAGVAGGVAAAELVRQRPLLAEERAFADVVFRGKVPYDRVMITNLLGAGGRPFAIPTFGDTILLNLGHGYENPTAYRGGGDRETEDDRKGRAPGQLLIHELVHAWQIAQSTFLPLTMCQGVTNQLGTLGGDMSVYHYQGAGADWGNGFGLEAQGDLVDEWFAGNLYKFDPAQEIHQKAYLPMDESGDNPFFRYIRDNIRAGVT